MQNFRYSDNGLALTKRYEGLRLTAYQDQAGVWTIGYGHTGKDVQPHQTISPLEAEAFLRADLRDAIDCVNTAINTPLNQSQFDSLVDFCFNAGRGNFLGSTLRALLNENRFEEAAGQFGRWIDVKGQLNRGLQGRRAAEAAMFHGTYRANSIA